jgi:SecD/SecF fusion protein
MRISNLRLGIYVAAILFALFAALPNILPDAQLARLPGFLPNERVTLGLDLRGGSHLVLEVDGAGLVRERLTQLNTDIREELRKANIGVEAMERQANGISVTLANAADRGRAQAALRTLAMPSALGAAADLDIAATAPEKISVTLSDAGMRDRINAATEQSVEIVRRRIDQIGVAEPTIQRVGADRILVQLPGIQDPGRIRTLLGSTAKLSFHMLAEGSGYGTRTLMGADDNRPYTIRAAAALDGSRLTDARAAFSGQTNEPIISFRLDSLGARRFADITRNNVGRPFAIVLDDKVLSAPVIDEPIPGGQGEIRGGFNIQQASDLAALLRAGALPAKLTVIEERTVGPDLGADAIDRGLQTGLIGFALVVGFMLLLYGSWGWLANLALFLNVVMTFGALSLLGATLTLPGIAGIVLGIGLAVDANVLINERIREETRKGARAIVALDLGFRRAYATIIDSNVTALIATALLFMFGSGPVKGFAVTMGLGIAISMFTAVSVVRLLMVAIVNWRKLAVLDIKPLFGHQLIPDGTSIRFMRGRFLGLAVSIFLSLASVALFIAPGLNYGIDFKGGLQMEVVAPKPIDLPPLRARLDGLAMGEIGLQQFQDGSRVLLRAERQAGGEAAQTAAMERIRAAVLAADKTAKIERTEVVGPKVSGELATAGFLSVFLASLAMLVYIWVRFEWPFAIGAIATLVLDVTKTVGFFALTGLEFNLTAIAALLTLIGYSVNDKVVVYDRMRENMRRYKAMPLRELIDLSINETLARSLYTSVTAFLALLPMAIWGGHAVESFAIPMVFGVVIAASSSVFIAAPILLFLGDWRQRRRKGARQVAEPDSAVSPDPA